MRIDWKREHKYCGVSQSWNLMALINIMHSTLNFDDGVGKIVNLSYFQFNSESCWQSIGRKRERESERRTLFVRRNLSNGDTIQFDLMGCDRMVSQRSLASLLTYENNLDCNKGWHSFKNKYEKKANPPAHINMLRPNSGGTQFVGTFKSFSICECVCVCEYALDMCMYFGLCLTIFLFFFCIPALGNRYKRQTLIVCLYVHVQSFEFIRLFGSFFYW